MTKPTILETRYEVDPVMLSDLKRWRVGKSKPVVIT